VLRGIIGWRRLWTVSMISALSMPCRWIEVMPRWLCRVGVWMTIWVSGVDAGPRAAGRACRAGSAAHAALIEIALGRERFLHAQRGAPQDHDPRAWPPAVRVVTGGA
jgi:hypothetical protein